MNLSEAFRCRFPACVRVHFSSVRGPVSCYILRLHCSSRFEQTTYMYTARAIENQCYVLAAAQYGKHNDKRVSFGHSVVSEVGCGMK